MEFRLSEPQELTHNKKEKRNLVILHHENERKKKWHEITKVEQTFPLHLKGLGPSNNLQLGSIKSLFVCLFFLTEFAPSRG